MDLLKKMIFSSFLLGVLFSCKKEGSDDPQPVLPVGPQATFPSVDYTQKASFTGTIRTDAVAFTLDGKAYVGLGADYADFHDDFKRYDPVTNSWTDLANFVDSRRSAVSFVVNDTAYVGLGEDEGAASSPKDFWQYQVGTDTWKKVSDLTFSCEGCETFVVNDEAYLLAGTNFYKFDHSNYTWDKMGDFPGDSRLDGVSFTIGSYAYYGTGYGSGNRKKDFWRYDPKNDSWKQIASFPGAARNNCFGFALGGYGFVGTGNDLQGQYEDVYIYNPNSNSWKKTTSYPGGKAYSLISFIIDGTAYIGVGDRSNKLYSMTIE